MLEHCIFDPVLLRETVRDILWEGKTEYGASVVIILNDKEEVLLLKRRKGVEWMPNKWAFAGGGIEKGETPSIAARREVKEETTLNVKSLHKLPSGKEGQEKVHYFWASDFTGKVKINDEHQEFKWVKISKLSKMDVVPKTQELANKVFKAQKKLNEDQLAKDLGNPPSDEPIQPQTKVISFDFDDTLFAWKDGEPNHMLIAKAQEYISKGLTVYIVSSRKNIPYNVDYVHNLVRQHKIPVQKVVFTNNAPKWETLVDLDVDIHYDDDEQELKDMQQNAPTIKPVWVRRFLVFEGGMGAGDKELR